MTTSKLFATCPFCGRRLCRAVSGSEIDTVCPKCGKTILIQVDKDGKVITQIIEGESLDN